MVKLDVLKQQVTSIIQKFKTTDFTTILKDDYVALPELEHRITEMYLAHTREMAER